MGLIQSLAEDALTVAVPEAGVPLRILGAVKSGAGKAADWISASAAHILVILLAVALVFGAYEHHAAAKWHKAADLGLVAIQSFKDVNALAVKQATAAKEITDAKNVKLAFASDQTADALRGGYDAAVLRLAAAQDRARRANLPGQPAAAQGAAGTGIGPVLPANTATITISTADGLTCADNTARLQAAHDWAVALGQ